MIYYVVSYGRFVFLSIQVVLNYKDQNSTKEANDSN